MPRKKKIEKEVVKEVEKVVKKAVKKTEKIAEEVMEDLGIEVGKISHYFDKIGVAVIELAKELGVGDLIRIKGTSTDFKQKVKSMQMEHKAVEKAKKGQAIGMKVEQPVKEHDRVYRVGE